MDSWLAGDPRVTNQGATARKKEEKKHDGTADSLQAIEQPISSCRTFFKKIKRLGFSLKRIENRRQWLAQILKRTNNIFELETYQSDVLDDDQPPAPTIQLKGQMLYMDEWAMIIFLGTPLMADLDAMIASGLYINDLSMHDFSRDLMMAGTQQSVELKLALDQEKQKAHKLELSMKKLDEEMKRTDELLYQMIPKAYHLLSYSFTRCSRL